MKIMCIALFLILLPYMITPVVATTSGVLYVNAQIVASPCQPQIKVQSNHNSLPDSSLQVYVNLNECSCDAYKRKYPPSGLRLGGQQVTLPKSSCNSTALFLIASKKTNFSLEMKYD
ncbi:hypothetical protein [Klebsiella aerogenes]|uniref:hypothetical protein n=1 Tax=Klebsiella aerogenes TaxID=548 RepID=UPI002DB72906|nr:hypothetical protein [Klebsiella aerogenes]MEB7534941.1 hypothetical protein [Klebsiella aerogenes]